MNADLALREVTLRGIGSYLYGQRLEVRPLTIICGPNGSGKSTWLKALCHFRDRCIEPDFPFAPVPELDANNLKLTNAHAYFQFAEYAFDGVENLHLGNKSLDREYGPPCTIGLHFEATNDFTLPPVEHEDADGSSDLQGFFWYGNCSRGIQFTVRIGHPAAFDDKLHVKGFGHFVELRVNRDYLVRFSTDDNLSRSYAVTCSAGILPELSGLPADREVLVATYAPGIDSEELVPTERMLSEGDARSLVECTVNRIRQLTQRFFGGFFYIGAIRIPPEYKNLDEKQDDDPSPRDQFQPAVKSRYVGKDGAAAWLLEREFAYNRMSRVDADTHTRDDALLEGFVSGWTESLLGVRIQHRARRLESESLSSAWGQTPVGYLLEEDPDKRNAANLDEKHPSDLCRLEQMCFRIEPQSPRQMSAGFHQVMPMIVQAALMRQYEVMAIENPEVHLHPGLQLSIAEFLIHQARSGKWIIIETHSDLIIRRVVREILEEKIGLGQAKVGIYFSNIDFEKPEEGYCYSTLEPICIDPVTRRVSNWPRGFLDDGVQESRRLLEAMYGPLPDEDEDLEE